MGIDVISGKIKRKCKGHLFAAGVSVRQSVTNVTSPELAATLNGINRGIGSLGLRLLGS